MSPLEAQLRARVEREGPISVADYMAACNAHYYATRDPLGRGGDFITAPEISQMFGELVGAWLADLWARAGRPDAAYVELGPGRGTLAADALRVMAKAGLTPSVHFVEISPTLRAKQATHFPQANWHVDISTLPDDRSLLVVANEFFDALPISQYDAAGNELTVSWADGRFVRNGEVAFEVPHGNPAYALGERLRQQSGAWLIIDYGYVVPITYESREPEFRCGDTLQAVSAHGFADPWVDPGSRDLSAHVHFMEIEESGYEADVGTFGPIGQGEWLRKLGIDVRAGALANALPERAEEIAAAHSRLTAPDQMGELFKVMAFVSRDWPEPAGFALPTRSP